MFIPTTLQEVKAAGWNGLDVILISGDAYIDSSYTGVSVIGHVLVNAGFRVGIIAQPNWNSDKDITRLSEPELFWGVTSGCVDSMVANYTATKKWRKSDDFTPGGINEKRPDRAVIKYSNLIRQHFKATKPIIIGGIEASLRRVAHFDYWNNKIRRSILFDAKADYLVYGMGERTIKAVAKALRNKKSIEDIRGLCWKSSELPESDYLLLPSFEETRDNKDAFEEMYHHFYKNTDPVSAKRLVQKQDTRYLVQNPPARYLNQQELDEIYEFDYENDAHPDEKKAGKIKALETIKFSITSHRGCYGECNFCAITVHQGRAIRSRSEDSIVREAEKMTTLKGFKGNIQNVGGPTANMYKADCIKMEKKGACDKKRCMSPELCRTMQIDHQDQINMLTRIRNIDGIKRVFVASGIRYDMVIDDQLSGDKYLENLVVHHVSGQLKIAPEHTDPEVLRIMGKPDNETLVSFKRKFDRFAKKHGRKSYLTYYMIAAHPGCGEIEMKKMKRFTGENLQINPEQVQVFTPTPSTYSTLMFHTGRDIQTGHKLFVERDNNRKDKQKATLTEKGSYRKNRYLKG